MLVLLVSASNVNGVSHYMRNASISCLRRILLSPQASKSRHDDFEQTSQNLSMTGNSWKLFSATCSGHSPPKDQSRGKTDPFIQGINEGWIFLVPSSVASAQVQHLSSKRSGRVRTLISSWLAVARAGSAKRRP